jgi:hypothetical protein
MLRFRLRCRVLYSAHVRRLEFCVPDVLGAKFVAVGLRRCHRLLGLSRTYRGGSLWRAG